MLNRQIAVIASGVVLAATPAVMAQTAQPRDGACFYEDVNYGGDRICIRAGETLDAMPRGMNDKVSSIRTYGQAEVRVYKDNSFSGSSSRIRDDVSDLRRGNWNDQISSVEVLDTYQGYRGQSRDGSYGRSSISAGRFVRRAYRDMLGRQPDPEELEYYRDRVIDEGWTEADIRQDLRGSAEFRERTSDSGQYGMTRQRAESIVRRAYRNVLDREPDPASTGYVERVLRDGWSLEDVERDLRRSAEYRNRIR